MYILIILWYPRIYSFVKLLLKIYYIPSHRSITKPCPTLWTHGHQAPLSSTISWNLHKFMPTESVMLSNLLILCHLLLLLPSVFPSISIFSSESALCIRWPKYWSFTFTLVLPMNIQGWFPLGLTNTSFNVIIKELLKYLFDMLLYWSNENLYRKYVSWEIDILGHRKSSLQSFYTA